ncbi:hypothetical protein M8C21_004984 [Ambrosia artemisiifolia]|uniref:Uncharacterized protein n=1 Tax=Ambrosia artemisiifolia TaxID=4212 RepID=A0AAD5GS00_AMBAR|nr:hypothetical protein M8C21_004984 [Ambrosia artemisiifolia]
MGRYEIKHHKWFKPINWKRLDAREIQPTFRPEVARNQCIANLDNRGDKVGGLDNGSDDDIEGLYDSCCELCDDGGVKGHVCDVSIQLWTLELAAAVNHSGFKTQLNTTLGSSNEPSSTKVQLQANQVYPCVSATCVTRYLPGNHSYVPSTNAIVVKAWKTQMSTNYRLPFVGDARSHIIGNACPVPLIDQCI